VGVQRDRHLLVTHIYLPTYSSPIQCDPEPTLGNTHEVRVETTIVSDYCVPVPRARPVTMPPGQLLEVTDALHAVARSYANAYVASHPTADPWVVFFAALHGLQDGVHAALDNLTSSHGGGGYV
jgi:hypothetical protein